MERKGSHNPLYEVQEFPDVSWEVERCAHEHTIGMG